MPRVTIIMTLTYLIRGNSNNGRFGQHYLFVWVRQAVSRIFTNRNIFLLTRVSMTSFQAMPVCFSCRHCSMDEHSLFGFVRWLGAISLYRLSAIVLCRQSASNRWVLSYTRIESSQCYGCPSSFRLLVAPDYWVQTQIVLSRTWKLTISTEIG